MFEIGYNIADDLPEEFSAYEKEVKQLTVGNTGKTGSLVIVLERDTQTDKTVASDLFSTIPLLVQRTLYIEESFPEMAYVYIMSPSGGILQGDRLKIDIKLKNNAQAHITTQAANKIYSMNANYATQIIDLSVDDNCYVEFIPDALIPYRSSRFYQRVNIRLHENATVVCSEIITPGRVASGECFAYDICCLKTVGTDQRGKVRFVDAMLLQPKKQNMLDIFMNSQRVFANMYLLTNRIDASILSDSIHTILDENSVDGSASVLPKHDGVIARIVANTSEEIKDVVNIILSRMRKDILGKQFTGLRKY